MKLKSIFAIVIALFLAGGAGYYIWNDLRDNEYPESDSEKSENIESGICAIDADEPCDDEETNNDSDVEEIPVPDLDRPVEFKSDVPNVIKIDTLGKISAVSESLKQNSDSLDNWINLGLLRKSIGDYEGARDAWEYASAIRPKNSLSFGNLGFLYGYYLNNNEKAEKNFMRAIENDSKLVYLYYQSFEFYRDKMKDDTKAKEIIKKGIAEIPANSKDFQTLLDNY